MRFANILAVAVALSGAATLVVEPEAFAQQEEIQEGDRAFEDGDLEKAGKKYDAAIRSNPAVSAEVYAKRASVYFLLKQLSEGLAFIDQKALPRYPGEADILEQKAVILFEMNRKKEAIDIADKVAKLKPSAFQAQLIRGTYYFRRDPAKSAEAYKAYLDNRPAELSKNDALPRLRLGIMYLQTKKVDEAERQFEIVQKQFRDNRTWQLNANNGLCAAYSGQRDYDRAITVCERIIENPKHIDRKGSVWYNLGRAYLAKNQPRKARQAGIEFTRVQGGSPKGYILIGDAYFAERNWEEALRNYADAEKRSQGDKGLLIQMGKTYRRMGKPMLALPRLEQAYSQDPSSVDIAVELGEVYLHPDVREDQKALSAVEKLLDDKNTNSHQLQYIAGRALYNQGKLAQARNRFMQAHKANESESKYLSGLIETINRQAADEFRNEDFKGAEKYLADAYGYDKTAPITNLNLAVIQLEQGECDKALPYLSLLRKRKRNETLANRLMARAYVCKKKPELNKAMALYEDAAKGVARNKLLQAEIYAEMAPMVMRKDLDRAIDLLETANTYGGQDPNVGPAIQRNLALAKFRRGWRHLRARGQTAEAVADFEVATRNPGLLRGTEREAFEFSLALAYLDAGNTTEAKKIFDELAKRGKQGGYLKEPYDKIGAEFFSAYANYRTNNLRARRDAANEFQKLARGAKGAFGKQLNDLVASAWEYVAWEEFQAGRGSAASSALKTAERYNKTRTTAHNQAALALNGRNASQYASTFDRMNASPPEALVNLGIAYDYMGKPKQAFDAWEQAKKRGVRFARLDDWISAKKRIFGF